MQQNGISQLAATARPDARFREDLHRALEQTHRQQLAHRQLHGDKKQESPGAGHQRLSLLINGLAALALLLLACGIGFYLGRRR